MRPPDSNTCFHISSGQLMLMKRNEKVEKKILQQC